MGREYSKPKEIQIASQKVKKNILKRTSKKPNPKPLSYLLKGFSSSKYLFGDKM